MDDLIKTCDVLSTFCASHPFCGACPAKLICGMYLPYDVELMHFMKELKNVLK